MRWQIGNSCTGIKEVEIKETTLKGTRIRVEYIGIVRGSRIEKWCL